MRYIAPKLCLILLLTYCTSFIIPNATTLLRAHFETESTWALPNKNLPGAPVGDAMTYDDALKPALKVVSPGLELKQGLEFSDIKINAETKYDHWIGFNAIPADIDQKAITYMWNGKSIKNKYGTTAPVYIDCSLQEPGGFGMPLVRMYITTGGELHAAAFGKGPNQPDLRLGNKVGNVGAGGQGVSVIINMAVKKPNKPTYKVTIFTPEGGNVGSYQGTIEWGLDDLKKKANKAAISFSYQDKPSDPDVKYMVDGISITQY